jgi:regulatory protein
MPIITKIVETRRDANRRSIHVDGKFAFALNVSVVARFRLREGMSISADEVERIKANEVRQACFDAALRILQSRLHSRSQLRGKLARKDYPADVIDGVLAELERLDYVNDRRFAQTKALSAAKHKHHGRRRAYVELAKAGVKSSDATAALDDVYAATDSVAIARQLAEKQAPRLKKLEAMTARRRLVGMLQRRGFDYETIKPVVDEVLGRD